MYSTVPGGESNTASGSHSFAAGKGAKATKDGSFVFGDSSSEDVTASATDEVRFQASGGFVIEGNLTATGTVTENSSIRYKTGVSDFSPEESDVLNLRLKRYVKKDTGHEEVGLIAEETIEHLPEVVKCDREGRPDAINYSRVGLHLVPEVSENRDRVESVEAVSNQCAETIDDLRSDLSARDARLADQADRIEQLAAENAQLTDRLTRLEGQLGTDGAVTGTTPADD
jgi:hypothetical protein